MTTNTNTNIAINKNINTKEENMQNNKNIKIASWYSFSSARAFIRWTKVDEDQKHELHISNRIVRAQQKYQDGLRATPPWGCVAEAWNELGEHGILKKLTNKVGIKAAQPNKVATAQEQLAALKAEREAIIKAKGFSPREVEAIKAKVAQKYVPRSAAAIKADWDAKVAASLARKDVAPATIAHKEELAKKAGERTFKAKGKACKYCGTTKKADGTPFKGRLDRHEAACVKNPESKAYARQQAMQDKLELERELFAQAARGNR